MTDAFTQLSTQVPDGFGALLAKSNEAAKPELEKQQAAEEEFAKQKANVMVAKAKEIAKSKQAGIGGEMAVYKKYDKELMAPAPTIQYSPDTAQGMQSLAVLLPLAGAMMGGKGLLSGIGAMNAMSGVLEGHRQGNQDRIALEQKNFEQKMNEWKIHMEQVKGAFDRALQMAKLNASGAQAQLEAKLAELDAPLLLADVKRNGISNAAQRNLNTIDKMTSMIQQAQMKLIVPDAKAVAAVTRGFDSTAELGRLVGPELAYGTQEKPAAAAVDRLKAIKQVRDLKQAAQDPDVKFGEAPSFFARAGGLFQRNITDTFKSNLAPLEGKEVSTSELSAAVDKSLSDAGLSAADKNSVFYKNAIFTILAAERAATGRSFLPVGIVNRLTPLLDPKGLSKPAFLQIMNDYENRISQGLPPEAIERAMKNLGGPIGSSTPSSNAEDPLGIR